MSDIQEELQHLDPYILEQVLKAKPYSMTSGTRLAHTYTTIQDLDARGITGDIVECGVWKGGHIIMSWLANTNTKRNFWLYDTFEGMAEPTEYDVNARTKELATVKYNQTKTDTHVDWCYASLEDVKKCCQSSGLDINAFTFIKGDVCETLKDPSNRPTQISVLRLDTDWYQSTKTELHWLYPVLSNNGVLIIDDYGHWQGSRKAVDEYFAKNPYKPLFNVVDFTGRSAIKINNMTGE